MQCDESNATAWLQYELSSLALDPRKLLWVAGYNIAYKTGQGSHTTAELTLGGHRSDRLNNLVRFTERLDHLNTLLPSADYKVALLHQLIEDIWPVQAR